MGRSRQGARRVGGGGSSSRQFAAICRPLVLTCEMLPEWFAGCWRGFMRQLGANRGGCFSRPEMRLLLPVDYRVKRRQVFPCKFLVLLF